jgi:hypothetical protein
MSEGNGAGSSNEELVALDAEIEELTRQKDDCERKRRELLQQEDLKSGRHHASRIHELQHEKLRLSVEIDARRKRRNRLLFSEGGGSGEWPF